MAKAEHIKRLRGVALNGAAPSSDFDLNPGIELPKDRVLRPAAVLIGFQMNGDGLDLVLTKRSSKLKHHPGQIAFPGGKMDATDASLTETALREAQEEIGLPVDQVEVLAQLPTHETVTSFEVTPILALIHGPFSPVLESGEVAEMFHVPFAHVTDPTRFEVQHRRWRGQRRMYYTVPFGPYYIWGATARILRGLSESIAS